MVWWWRRRRRLFRISLQADVAIFSVSVSSVFWCGHPEARGGDATARPPPRVAAALAWRAMKYAVHGEVLPGPGARGDDSGSAVSQDVASKADAAVAHAVQLERDFEVSFARRGFFPKDLYDDADRAPAGTAFPSSKAVKQRNFVLRPDFQKMHAEIADEEADMEKNKKFGKAAEKGAAFRRLTAGATTHPWDRDGKVQEREVEEHAMKELEDDARRRNLETHEQRSADVAKKRKTIREGTLDVD